MKKIYIAIFMAALLLSACKTTPQNTAQETDEAVGVTPEWMVKLEEAHARNMEAKKKKEEEIKQWMAQKPAKLPAPEKVNKQECKIGGYNCWDVLKLFSLTAEGTKEQRDEKLKKMGLSVTNFITYRDGGSMDYELSDGTRFHIKNSLWDRSGDMIVQLTNGNIIYYDAQGYQKEGLKSVF